MALNMANMTMLTQANQPLLNLSQGCPHIICDFLDFQVNFLKVKQVSHWICSKFSNVHGLLAALVGLAQH